MHLTVARIGRAHGIRGEVAVEVRTDDPDRRLAAGAVLLTDRPGVGPLTVTARRWHSGRLLLRLHGIGDRTAAEALRGVGLLVDEPAGREADQRPDEYHDHELVGLAAVHVDGSPLGVVREVLHLPGHEVLAIANDGGREVLVPFVAAIVTEIDTAAGRLTVDPPAGLLDLDAGPAGAGG